MFASLNLLRDKPNQVMFRPGLLGLLINPAYLVRAALYKAVQVAARPMHGKILDFGCGSKPYAHLFVGAESYIGIDIEYSGHDHTASEVDVFFDGANIPFPDQHFDGVVSFETLEHVFDINSVVRELNRVLNNGGQLLVTIPFAWPEHEKPFDFGRYTTFGIKYILENNGFEIENVVKTGNFFIAIAQLWIEYFRATFFPRSRFIRAFINIVFIFPFTILISIINLLMPKNEDFYCNIVISARKYK